MCLIFIKRWLHIVQYIFCLDVFIFNIHFVIEFKDVPALFPFYLLFFLPRHHYFEIYFRGSGLFSQPYATVLDGVKLINAVQDVYLDNKVTIA